MFERLAAKLLGKQTPLGANKRNGIQIQATVEKSHIAARKALECQRNMWMKKRKMPKNTLLI